MVWKMSVVYPIPRVPTKPVTAPPEAVRIPPISSIILRAPIITGLETVKAKIKVILKEPAGHAAISYPIKIYVDGEKYEEFHITIPPNTRIFEYSFALKLLPGMRKIQVSMHYYEEKRKIEVKSNEVRVYIAKF